MQSDAPGQNVKQFDKETWEWHNAVRTNPQSVISDLELMLT